MPPDGALFDIRAAPHQGGGKQRCARHATRLHAPPETTPFVVLSAAAAGPAQRFVNQSTAP